MCLGWGKGCSSKDNEEEGIPPRIEESREPFFLALAKCDIFEVTNKKSRCLNLFLRAVRTAAIGFGGSYGGG